MDEAHATLKWEKGFAIGCLKLSGSKRKTPVGTRQSMEAFDFEMCGYHSLSIYPTKGEDIP